MKRLGLVLIIAPVLLLAIHYGSDLLAAERCLRAGGSFDYQARTCSFTQRSDYVPYAQRYRWSLNIALGVSLAGLVVFVLGGSRARTHDLRFNQPRGDTR